MNRPCLAHRPRPRDSATPRPGRTLGPSLYGHTEEVPKLRGTRAAPRHPKTPTCFRSTRTTAGDHPSHRAGTARRRPARVGDGARRTGANPPTERGSHARSSAGSERPPSEARGAPPTITATVDRHDRRRISGGEPRPPDDRAGYRAPGTGPPARPPTAPPRHPVPPRDASEHASLHRPPRRTRPTPTPPTPTPPPRAPARGLSTEDRLPHRPDPDTTATRPDVGDSPPRRKSPIPTSTDPARRAPADRLTSHTAHGRKASPPLVQAKRSTGRGADGSDIRSKSGRTARVEFRPVDIMLNLQALVRSP